MFGFLGVLGRYVSEVSQRVSKWFWDVGGGLVGEKEKTSQNKPEWVRKGGLGERGDVVVREIGGRFIKIIHWAIPLNAKANPLAFRQ